MTLPAGGSATATVETQAGGPSARGAAWPPSSQPQPVALVGVTASGKSAAALESARAAARAGVAVELVSVDSMAVYRGMDVGTETPSPAVRREFPYHLLDLVDPAEDFSVGEFQAAASEAVEGITRRGHRPVLVGGTGLYLRAVTDGLVFPGRFPSVAAELAGYLDAAGPRGSVARRERLAGLHSQLAELDPRAAARMEAANERRILRALEVTLGAGRPFSSFGPGLDRYPATRVRMVGILPDLSGLGRRVAQRLERQMEAGFLDEVRSLAGRASGLSRTARQALGYRELLAHVEEGLPLRVALDETTRRTRAFARRQWAWFRRDPRIEWVETAEQATARLLAHVTGCADLDEVGRSTG